MRRKAAVAVVLIIMSAAGVRLLFWGRIRAFLYRNYTEVRVVQDSNWFDYPVGPPDARGYYRAQRFGGHEMHLGEDWNGMGGGNSDYGDPVYAIANGRVTRCDETGSGWGNVVRVVHPVGNGEKPVDALYAHLSEVRVHEGQSVKRGQVIGTIGDADGLYQAHLHLEIRKVAGQPLGRGYGRNEDGLFYDPSEFIDKHRKKT